MRKLFVTLLASAACATSIAHAEEKPVTVNFSYDSAMLATEDGAKEVLESLTDAAIEACSYERAITGAPTFDRACRDSLVKEAIAQISADASAEGKSVTYVFASVE